MKGVNAVTLDVRELSNVMDYLVVCSGNSNRHVKSLAENVSMKCKEAGHRPLGIEGADAGEWVLVDLGDVVATHENRGTMFDLATRTAEQCFMPLTIGGGVRTHHDVRDLLLAGADKVSFNSAAVADPNVVAEAAERFGSQCIVVAIDAKTVSPGKWEIFTHGGRKATGIDAVGFAKTVVAKGAGEILLTSMDRDGTKSGFNLPLTKAVSDAVNVPVIASGGVGTLDHLVEGVTEGGASAVLAASIFHFGTYTIAEAKSHMAAAGIPVRLT